MDILKVARQLRLERQIEESYDLVKKSLGKDPRYASVVWQHHSMFWRDIAAGDVLLTRREGSDAEFIRALWQRKEFLYSFHRLAPPLPATATDLQKVLNNEYVSLLSDAASIHWIIRDRLRKPWGILSLTNASVHHKRAELLLGVLPAARFGMGTAALLLLFRFFFRDMQFNKLCSLVFDDNPHSCKGALHAGFQLEGRLREHVWDPAANRFVDLLQLGLLADDAFSEKNARLSTRLFK